MLIRWPVDPAEQLVDGFWRLDRVFDQAFGGLNEGDRFGRQRWIPAADVAEDDKQLTLTFELPGVKAEDLAIEVSDDGLTISGHKRVESRADGRSRPVERRFERRFSLPEQVNAQGITASLADGVLRVALPKVAKAEPRRIPIDTGNQAPEPVPVAA